MSLIRRRSETNLEDVASLGKELSSKGKILDSLQEAVDSTYNGSSDMLHQFSSTIEELAKFVDDSSRKAEKFGQEVVYLDSLQKDQQRLREHLTTLIRKKEEKERKKLSDGDKEELIAYLNGEGRKKLHDISSSYLKIAQDISTAKGLIASYVPSLDKYKQISQSLLVLRQDVSDQVRKAKELLHTYQIIGGTELDALKTLSLPEGFIARLNQLADGVEKIDEGFVKKVLEVILKQSTPIKNPNTEEVLHGLIRHLNKKRGE